MLSVIGNQIRQGEAGIVGHIINHACLPGILTQAAQGWQQGTFVAFQEMADRIHKIVIINRQILICGNIAVIINFITGKIGIKKLGIAQHRFRSQKRRGDMDSQQMEAIHMAAEHPVFDNLKNICPLYIHRKIELHDYLNPVLMQLLHHVLKFLRRAVGAGIGHFGCKIVSLLIPPVIDPGRFLFPCG